MGAETPPAAIEDLTTLFKVLGEPNRLLILDLLMQGVQCNCEIGHSLQMAPNLISHHLRVLREAGLVGVERDTLDARWVYYAIDSQALGEFHRLAGAFLDPARIQSRRPNCGPERALVLDIDAA